MRVLSALLLLVVAATADAGPYVEPGDLALRHDLQQLADHGVIEGPVSTWPLAWGPILEDLRGADTAGLPSTVLDSMARVRNRASWETRTRELRFDASAAVSSEPTRIRSFQATPRGDAEVSGRIGWTDNWINVDLNVQAVDSEQDDNEIRGDGSMVGVVLGNWSVAASTQQRWWGPGWDGSLILSNNARPFPALVLDRVFTDPFESKWLSWLGPWDLNVMFGQLEKDRVVPDAQFFGLRFNFRPLRTLEIGISRSAQWCGDGRPCDFDTFADLFLGRDNRGDAGIGADNEPGNQLAGVDFRWAPRFLDGKAAFYGQFIGEDEAGGFPSRYIAQVGVDGAGVVLDDWSYRYFAEAISTTCDFWKSDELFNCAYNHGIYQTGYRYRARAIGHGADNDARLVSAGLVVVDPADTQWRALLRVGRLNRGGPPDTAHTLTPVSQDIASIDISHSRVFSFGVIDIGAGYESIDDAGAGSSSDGRFYLQWRSAY